MANFLLHTVQLLPIGAQKFAAIYLLGHGMKKLWLIVGLLRKRLWYYPVSMTVFGLFIAYQVYRYTFTHSVCVAARHHIGHRHFRSHMARVPVPSKRAASSLGEFLSALRSTGLSGGI
ncbi:DUF2127 domain-containing protein [Paraburkholderia terrae]|uniref:DUF2127 domain-containing protein n=1 Tax=Paraburkholderia terrae TaxID=311230 RepID=UPI001E368E0E|nr:DUF2127 domain-containing protein [Paraburkholderia terrae]